MICICMHIECIFFNFTNILYLIYNQAFNQLFDKIKNYEWIHVNQPIVMGKHLNECNK